MMPEPLFTFRAIGFARTPFKANDAGAERSGHEARGEWRARNPAGVRGRPHAHRRLLASLRHLGFRSFGTLLASSARRPATTSRTAFSRRVRRFVRIRSRLPSSSFSAATALPSTSTASTCSTERRFSTSSRTCRAPRLENVAPRMAGRARETGARKEQRLNLTDRSRVARELLVSCK